MREEWRDIKGYEGFYQVSNFGNIKSLAREIKRRNQGSVYKVETYKKATICPKTGYRKLFLSKNGVNKCFSVHSLVANQFLDKVNIKDVVDHISGDKLNNRADNLRFVSQSKNLSNVNKKIINGKATSRYKGVSFSKEKNKYYARIYVNSVKKWLGYFSDELQAANAYNNAALLLNNNHKLNIIS